jgi:hypothetical protein
MKSSKQYMELVEVYVDAAAVQTDDEYGHAKASVFANMAIASALAAIALDLKDIGGIMLYEAETKRKSGI